MASAAVRLQTELDDTKSRLFPMTIFEKQKTIGLASSWIKT